jgi:BirA family biotin operon repressor/biotin-[acetyl-CoA-carboxylase] ligase
MIIIKVGATDSTNLHLKRLIADELLNDYTVLVAKEQVSGRGQAGAKWLSKPGKNLTFSVLKKFEGWPVTSQFMISMATSLAIYEALTDLNIPNLAIKWPNDILSGTNKIGGILIENTLKGDMIHRSVIGVGLNVNQELFEGLTHVSSLKLLTGAAYDLDVVLETILQKMKLVFHSLVNNDNEAIERRYHEVLFRKGIDSTFEVKGQLLQGCILGVSTSGKLLVSFKPVLSKNLYALHVAQVL